MRYLTQSLITLAIITFSTYTYSQCGAPPPGLLCDADDSGVVDATDIQLISDAKGETAPPGDVRDIDMDGMITVLDARQCVDECSSSTECADALTSCTGTEVQPERLFLQQLGSDSVIIKWRGNTEGGAEAAKVCFGTDMIDLQKTSKTWATTTATGHREVLLSGLTPDTKYYYSVGGAGVADTSRHFRTAPAVGNLPTDDGNTRIWILGDSGVAGYGGGGTGAQDVRDGFKTYVGSGEPADLVLMLGDNAYAQGTDVEHQIAIFDVYPDILASTPLWPTIGNHEMGLIGLGTETDTINYEAIGNPPNGLPNDPPPDSPMPYLNIFSLPTGGEIGGISSTTEQYYSFDYGNVHIVSLDSQVAMRDPTNNSIMKSWLINDLTANINAGNTDWTIVIFHHPPYSKGSHDSDTFGTFANDQPMTIVREEYTPLFESLGVDLAYAGHSHIYERSYYIKNHDGLSGTFDPVSMPELNLAGTAPGTGVGPTPLDPNPPYTQVSIGSTLDDRVVYTVAGSSGSATSTKPGFPHPAHAFGQLTAGSVVIDLDEDSLEASFVDVDGNVVESFIMTRIP